MIRKELLKSDLQHGTYRLEAQQANQCVDNPRKLCKGLNYVELDYRHNKLLFFVRHRWISKRNIVRDGNKNKVIDNSQGSAKLMLQGSDESKGHTFLPMEGFETAFCRDILREIKK